MITIDDYIRFTRVDALDETDTSALADLHREQLRIDVTRANAVRIRISGSGAFDGSPVSPRVRSTGSTSAAGSNPNTSSPDRTCRGSSPRTPN